MQESQRRSRRAHSAAFKSKVVAESEAVGASVAQVALRHGVNANLVHRWRRAAQRGLPAVAQAPAFLPLVIPTAAPVTSSPSPAQSSAASEIRIELRRGTATVSVSWPASAAAECGTWLAEWLR
ncbi:transposase [Niveibacterium sp. 24ML]|uniref:IS66-like element accessory protein TnpA n=1 Tax=Niveibacterium sp. 24ML TaxID=2985512 RepID=UPI002271E4EE|nr:transposase [Niveibacterium sp. 24ML]MCX9157970.1 transposase [Niveibacterium sp. 24ML]